MVTCEVRVIAIVHQPPEPKDQRFGRLQTFLEPGFVADQLVQTVEQEASVSAL